MVLFEFGRQLGVVIIFLPSTLVLVIDTQLSHLLLTLLQVLAQFRLQFLIANKSVRQQSLHVQLHIWLLFQILAGDNDWLPT